MPRNAQALTIEVVSFPGFPEDQPVIPQTTRIADGPTPVFGDTDTWDLNALGMTPSETPSTAVFYFGSLSTDWNYFARSFFMALINPLDDLLISSALQQSAPIPKIKTLRHHYYGIRRLSEWADIRGKSANLNTWTSGDLDEYFAWIRQSFSPSALDQADLLLKKIFILGPALPSFLECNPPKSVRRPANGDIKTKPIAPSDFWALIHACWTYIDVFGPDILKARESLAAQNSHWEQLPPEANQREMNRLLTEHFQQPGAFVPLHCTSKGNVTKGEINWQGLTRLLNFRGKSAVTVNPRLTTRYQIVLNAMGKGVPTKYGHTGPAPTEIRRLDGSSAPWCPGFDSHLLLFETTKLRTACFIFIAALSMMRISEVCGLKKGCLTTYYGATAVQGDLYKHQSSLGNAAYWWISEPVVRAIEIAESLSDHEDLLFGSLKGSGQGFDKFDEIRRFVKWVNEAGPQRGLAPILDSAISAHRLRRTMAIITATQPDGEIALGITLKHNATRALANSTTSGYGAPSAAWARDLKLEEASANAAELISDWSKQESGDFGVHGPGAEQYRNLLARVGQKKTLKAAIGDERMLRELLRDDASKITLGTLNHCLGDSTKAECLKGLDEEAKKAGPIMAACSPTRCRNSVITEEHLPIWIAEEVELKKLLRDRRMADNHREQLKHQLKDVQRVTKASDHE